MLEKVSLSDRQPVFGLLLDVLEDSRGLQQVNHYLHAKQSQRNPVPVAEG